MNSLKELHTHESLEKIYLESIYYSFAIGADNVSHTTFNKNLDNEIAISYRKLKNETYEFTRYKLNFLSKGRQKYPREIYIPTIRDRIILKSIHKFLKEIYYEIEHQLPQSIIREVSSRLPIYDTFIKIDIQNFYPSISHQILFDQLTEKINCNYSINLIKKSLQPKRNEIIGGVPQGLSISNILASIYLKELDQSLKDNSLINYFRYVDDILILCNRKDYQSLINSIENKFSKLKLKIHPIEDFSKSKTGSIINDNFDYLGYEFSKNKITVRKSSINHLYSNIIQCFSLYKYSSNKNIQFLLFQLNLKITGCIDDGKAKGWLFFFSEINDLTLLKKLDNFVLETWKKFKIDVSYLKYLKTFTRSYHEIKFNFKKSKYFDNFDHFTLGQKIEILNNIFGISTSGLTDPEIHEKFKIKTKNQINKLLIDLKNFS